MVSLGGMGPQGALDLLDPLAPRVGVPSTPGGGRPPALRYQALRCSTLGLQEDRFLIREGEEPTTFACPQTRSITLASGIKEE